MRQENSIVEAIFMAPSNEMVVGKFVSFNQANTAAAAGCGGTCNSGVCSS